jgi:hypothetical protein
LDFGKVVGGVVGGCRRLGSGVELVVVGRNIHTPPITTVELSCQWVVSIGLSMIILVSFHIRYCERLVKVLQEFVNHGQDIILGVEGSMLLMCKAVHLFTF